MKVSKKVLSIILAIMMFVSILPITANAATSGSCGDNLTWKYSSNTLTISGTGPMSEYDSFQQPWISYLTNIKKVIINNGATSISRNAFESHRMLTNVMLPNTITLIGDNAFYFCDSLTSVTIPDGVTSIGANAFGVCCSLTSITVSDNNQHYSNDNYGVLFNKNMSVLVRYPAGNTSENYVIPDSTTTVNEYAFDNCYYLASITIPNSVISISDFAFFGANVTSVSIPNSITSINASVFRSCTSLTNITIPDSVRSIGEFAFYDCESLTDVYYSGTKEQWNNITIDNTYNGNDPLINATIHYNSTGPDSDDSGEEAITPEIKIGADKNSFGEDVSGLAEDTLDCLVVYTSADYDTTSLTVKSSNSNIVSVGTISHDVGGYIGGEYDHKATVYLNLKAEGTATITVTSPEGINESIKVTVEEKDKSIAVFSTNKSFTVKTGDKMGLSFGIMTDGVLEEDWKEMSIVVSDPTIVSLGNYEEVEYGYKINVTGLKEGSTNLTITDTETGLSTSIIVSVFDEYTETYSYSIENIATFHPNNSWEDHLDTCIYDMNGLYVDNYSATKSGDKYIVTFDVYNQGYHHGAVDIYDADGNWISSEQIEKYSDISSLYDTGEQIYYMICGGNWLTYQHPMHSQKTEIKEIEVPDGGYFTISNNYAESPGCFLYNSCEIFYEGISAVIDILTGDVEAPFVDLVTGNITDNEATRELFYELFIKAADKEIREYSKNILEGNIDDAYCSISGLLENMLYSLDIDWKHLLETASGLGESAFEKFAGPAGLALKACFGFAEALDRYCQVLDMGNSINEAYATVYSSIDEGFINPYGVTVNTNGNMDAEAVLQVFRISNDDSVDVILNSDNPLEQHELYNICFVKNDELVQPNGKVKVYVPIPEGMDSNTCVIYRQETDGSWTILDATIENNYLVFETDHFSLYALVGNRTELTITSLPNKLTYTRNEVLDTTGLALELNGEIITNGYYCDPTVMYEYGTQTITVKYGCTTAKFEVNVEEPIYNYTFSIQSPSTTTIRKKDGIILHANIEGNAPDGSYVVWTASNNKFTTSTVDEDSLKIVSNKNGYTTFTATLYDADGNALASDTIEMRSKAGFFDVIASWFRKATIYES